MSSRQLRPLKNETRGKFKQEISELKSGSTILSHLAVFVEIRSEFPMREKRTIGKLHISRTKQKVKNTKRERERERERAFSRAKYKIYVTSDVIDVIPQSHAGAVSSLALHSVC